MNDSETRRHGDTERKRHRVTASPRHRVIGYLIKSSRLKTLAWIGSKNVFG